VEPLWLLRQCLSKQLKRILSNFLVDKPESQKLLAGFNAPLGTISARASAAFVLGLIQENEFKEITLIRKIRNEFGHGWKSVSFGLGKIADFCLQLPWLGPQELESEATPRARFDFVVAILLTDLLWRARLVAKERRTPKVWPNKARNK